LDDKLGIGSGRFGHNGVDQSPENSLNHAAANLPQKVKHVLVNIQAPLAQLWLCGQQSIRKQRDGLFDLLSVVSVHGSVLWR
jgi:hypothetical protein